MSPRPSTRLREAQAAIASYRAQQAAQPDQPDLFSTLAAIESVAEHAGDEWRTAALEVVQRVARSRPTLTIEDVAPLVPDTPDRRALGYVMLAAKTSGWLEALGYVNSGAERHGKPIRLWRSRLHQPSTPATEADHGTTT